MLKRIVALLFALADLAEQAAHRSAPVRWLVLWVLWQAEAVARDFVTGRASNAAGRPWPPAATTIRHGSADATTLAVSLRSLALVLGSLAARFRRRSFRQPGASDAGSRQGTWSDRRQRADQAIAGLCKAALRAVERCDTS